MGFPDSSVGKESTCNAGDPGLIPGSGRSAGEGIGCPLQYCGYSFWGPGFNPWVGKIPWRRKWLPTPVFLPGESHGQRRLAGKSPWGHKEADTTEQLTHSLSGQGKCLCIHVHLTDGQWMDENRIHDIYLTGITPLLQMY